MSFPKIKLKWFRRRSRSLLSFLLSLVQCRSRSWIGRIPYLLGVRRMTKRLDRRALAWINSAVDYSFKSAPWFAPLSAACIDLLIVEAWLQFQYNIRPDLSQSIGTQFSDVLSLTFLFVLSCTLLNHQLCIWTPPGIINSSTTLTIAEASAVPQIVDSNMVKSLASSDSSVLAHHLAAKCAAFDPELCEETTRFCEVCRVSKPWRAHHCRVCNACVLRMDHHCVFVCNCVGFANYKYFVALCFYGCLAGVLFVVCGFRTLFRFYRVRFGLAFLVPFIIVGKPVHDSVDVFGLFWLTFFAGVCTAVSVGALLLWHVYISVRNETTLECVADSLSKDFKHDIGNRYSMGSPIANLRQVFGHNWWLVLAPIAMCKPPGNGMVYPLRTETYDTVFVENENLNALALV